LHQVSLFLRIVTKLIGEFASSCHKFKSSVNVKITAIHEQLFPLSHCGNLISQVLLQQIVTCYFFKISSSTHAAFTFILDGVLSQPV
jgi:hypothetical protein